MRVVVFGNSGAGKSTFAKKIAAAEGLAHLDLDTLAWAPGISPPQRLSLDDSAKKIAAFTSENPTWVIEGCYADLIALLLDDVTEMVFLNPGVERCVAFAQRRDWEPHKFASKDEQDAALPFLLDWIRAYDTRDDPAFSYRAHRALFDSFRGSKREVATATLG